VTGQRAHAKAQQDRIALLERQVATLTAPSERNAAFLERSKDSE
jgi:hypothetical protein